MELLCHDGNVMFVLHCINQGGKARATCSIFLLSVSQIVCESGYLRNIKETLGMQTNLYYIDMSTVD